MSTSTSKDRKPFVKSNVRPGDGSTPHREKDFDNRKPYLSVPHPSAELIRKHIWAVKTFVQSDHAMAKGWEVPVQDGSGNVVNVTQTMVDIFPDYDANPGEYPKTIIPRTFASHGGGLSDLELKDLETQIKEDWRELAKQRETIITGKIQIMGILSGSLNPAIKSQLRKTQVGKQAIDSENDPLTLINLLLRTDFSKGATNSISPMMTYHNSRMMLFSVGFKQEMHESLDMWKNKFNSQVEIVKKNAAIVGGACAQETLTEESLGWLYYSKLNAKFNELRTRVETNLLRPTPNTVEEWIEQARFWDTNTVEYSGAGASTTAASSKGAYVTTSEAGGKSGTKLSCRTHNTNEHRWNDEVCRALRASEPANGSNGGKNQPKESKKGSSDGSKKGGDGKGSGKAS